MANKAKQGDGKSYLWTEDTFNKQRIDADPAHIKSHPAHIKSRTVIGVDPVSSFGSEKCNNEVGIVVVSYSGIDGNGYLFEDLSGTHTPEKWGEIVIEEAWKQQQQLGNECLVVGEENFGGSMIKMVIEAINSESKYADVTATYKNVIATREKEIIQSEIISVLYHLGRVYHVGKFQELERQLCLLKPNEKTKNLPRGESFCRANALIFAVTELHESGVLNGSGGRLPMPGGMV